MKPFSLFVNNFHPEQRAANPFTPNPERMRRIAVGDGLDKPAYTEAVMKAWRERAPFSWNIEGFSLHNYVAPTTTPLADSSTDFGEKEYAGLLAKSYSTERMVEQHSAIMDKYDPGKEVGIAVDEWGAWLKPLPEKPMMFLRQQNSLRDALSAAIHLNGFARHADRVRMANIAQMVNVIQAMILTDGDKMLLTPTYHVFRMYVPFQDAALVPVKLDAGTYSFGGNSVPAVDAVAAKAKDGTLWLALVNADPGKPITVSPTGLNAKGAKGEVLTADKVNAYNTFAAPGVVAPKPYSAKARGGTLSLTLAPKSLTVVRLER